MLRRTMLIGAGALLVTPAAAHHAAMDAGPAMIGGYDAVAYFAGSARRGRARHAARDGDDLFHFASAANRDAFLAAPARYRPAYDGHCAFGVRMGHRYATDPRVFEIHAGRLFLFLDIGTRAIWREAPAANVAIADGIWDSLGRTAG